jgi:hypothetical protein
LDNFYINFVYGLQVRQRYSRIKKKMLDNPDFKLNLMKRWKRGVSQSRISQQAETKKPRKRKRNSGGNSESGNPFSESSQSLELLIQTIRPPKSHEDVLRQLEMAFALVCPKVSVSDKADAILSDESYSEFHEPVRLLKGRRRSVRSKSHNRLAVEVSLCTKPKYQKLAPKPLFEGEKFQEYLKKLIQLPSQLTSESQ